MGSDPSTTRGGGFPLDLTQASPRYSRWKREKSPWAVLLGACAIPAIIAVVAGVGWWRLSQDSSSVTILPMSDQEITQGEQLRMRIPIRRVGYQPEQLTYSLDRAPPDATVDARAGVFTWATTDAHKAGTYQMVVKVLASAAQPGEAVVGVQRTFTVRLRERIHKASPRDTGPSFDDILKDKYAENNPFETQAELTPQGKIDEFVFAKLKELKIEPANLCSDGVFLRRAFLDTIGTLPTVEEAKRFLEDTSPNKRAVLVDQLLERPEFATHWAMKWCDLLRVKAEFPINLWPNAAQAYHRWIRASIEENMPYDRFVRALLTSCGSNFRTPQVNFYRALQNKEPTAIAQAVALAFMGERAENWPKERLTGMAVFFSQVGYKRTDEWKEEIIVFDPRKVMPPPKDQSPGDVKDAKPPAPVFPDGTPAQIPPGRDPREVFADWLINPENPWFSRQIVNRVWYWLLGRGIVHEPDDIRSDNPPQNPELLNWLAEELVQAHYDLKHIFRLILNSKTYQLSCIPKSKGPEAAANFACYALRRLDAEVLIDALCQITGTTESYSSMIPEPFTFIPERERTSALPDGSITSSFLEMFGRPPRDTGLESERNNRVTAAQELHLLNSSHIREKIQKGPKLQEIVETTGSRQMAETLYLAILSRLPTDAELGEISWQCDSRWGGQNLAWALINSEEFLFRH